VQKSPLSPVFIGDSGDFYNLQFTFLVSHSLHFEEMWSKEMRGKEGVAER
jgi:hypothetical protein